MTIAGLDPSGGAGILADTRTFAAFNCYPVAVVTAITFQNSSGVSGYVAEQPETVAGQLLALFAELPIAAVKTGMLPTREIVREISKVLGERSKAPLVIDPVMSSSSGYELMDALAVTELKDRLLPHATLITPNIPEAQKLVEFSIRDVDDMLRAAEKIRGEGARAVLIKGGHLEQKIPIADVLNDEGRVAVFTGERIASAGFRGTGCTLASAIAACLTQGKPLKQSVERAREFLIERMRSALLLGTKEVLY
jgi:hydroxymethylpyrimidine kinase/phosphomethylpyrimidine kinase